MGDMVRGSGLAHGAYRPLIAYERVVVGSTGSAGSEGSVGSVGSAGAEGAAGAAGVVRRISSS